MDAKKDVKMYEGMLGEGLDLCHLQGQKDNRHTLLEAVPLLNISTAKLISRTSMNKPHSTGNCRTLISQLDRKIVNIVLSIVLLSSV